jgi:hypothetical protein
MRNLHRARENENGNNRNRTPQPRSFFYFLHIHLHLHLTQEIESKKFVLKKIGKVPIYFNNSAINESASFGLKSASLTRYESMSERSTLSDSVPLPPLGVFLTICSFENCVERERGRRSRRKGGRGSRAAGEPGVSLFSHNPNPKESHRKSQAHQRPSQAAAQDHRTSTTSVQSSTVRVRRTNACFLTFIEYFFSSRLSALRALFSRWQW